MMSDKFEDLPFSVRLLVDEKLFDRVTKVAEMLAKSEATTPPFLLGKTNACFAIVCMSMDWGLNPFMVMRKVYLPKKDSPSFAFMSELVFSILAASKRFDELPEPTYEGPWDQIQGVSKEITGQSGGRYRVPNWPFDLNKQAFCNISFKLKDDKTRTFRISLAQAFPMNSVLWATDPQQQLWYLGLRRCASRYFPHVLMGIPDPNDVGFPIDDDVLEGEAEAPAVAPAALEAPTEAPMDLLVKKQRADLGREPVPAKAAEPADRPAAAAPQAAAEPPQAAAEPPAEQPDDDGMEPDEVGIVDEPEDDNQPADDVATGTEPVSVAVKQPGKREPVIYESHFDARLGIDELFRANRQNVAWVAQWRKLNQVLANDPFYREYFSDGDGA